MSRRSIFGNMVYSCTSYVQRPCVVAGLCAMIMLSAIAMLPLIRGDSWSTVSPSPQPETKDDANVAFERPYNYLFGFNPLNQTSSDSPRPSSTSSSMSSPVNETASTFPQTQNRTVDDDEAGGCQEDDDDSVRDVPRRKQHRTIRSTLLFVSDMKRPSPSLRRHRFPKPPSVGNHRDDDDNHVEVATKE